MDPQDDDNHPLNPGGVMEVARIPLNPGGGSQDRWADNDINQSGAASLDRAKASRRDTSHDVEQAALMSGAAQSDRAEASRRDTSHDVELAEIPRREPSDDSRSYTSGGGSSSGSDDSEKTKSCPETRECLRTVLVKLRIWIQALQKFCKPVTDRLKKFGKKVAKYGPMIVTFIGISLLTYDQYTDVKTGVVICDMPCTCVWNNNPENTTTEQFKKNKGICEGAGDSKENRTCYDSFGNEDLIGRFCHPVDNATLCDELESWTSNGFRHPNYCATTIGTIAGSSFITSTYLLLRIRQLYISMLTYLGWNQNDHPRLFNALYIIIHVLWILQILPHAWIVMTFFICFKSWKREREIIRDEGKKHWEEADEKDDWEDREPWEESNRRAKIIFAIFEDTPQLTLHSMFIINSVVKQERVLVFSGLEYLGYMYYIGAITSAFSMAWALAIYKQSPNPKDKAIQFGSSVLAVGSRAFICACYASTISEDFAFQTWTLMLPPATSFGLYIIDQLVTSLYKGDTKLRKWNIKEHADSIWNWVKLPTWNNFKRMMDKIFETVTSAVVSLIFEGNSVESLIPAYTYLGYAVVLNTMWISETSETTKVVLEVIQFLALASVLLNLLIVQLEGKHKVRCLLYSLVFLLFLVLLQHSVGIGYDGVLDFAALKKFYFTDKAVDNIPKLEITKLKDKTVSSLTDMLIIAGVTSSLNLILKIASLIRDCFISALIPPREHKISE